MEDQTTARPSSVRRLGILAATYVVGVILIFIALTIADAILTEPAHISLRHRLFKALAMSGYMMALSATAKYIARPFTSRTAQQGSSKRT